MPNILEKPVLGAISSGDFVITRQEQPPTGTSIFMKVAFALMAGVIVVSVLNKRIPG